MIPISACRFVPTNVFRLTMDAPGKAFDEIAQAAGLPRNQWADLPKALAPLLRASAERLASKSSFVSFNENRMSSSESTGPSTGSISPKESCSVPPNISAAVTDDWLAENVMQWTLRAGEWVDLEETPVMNHEHWRPTGDTHQARMVLTELLGSLGEAHANADATLVWLSCWQVALIDPRLSVTRALAILLGVKRGFGAGQ